MAEKKKIITVLLLVMGIAALVHFQCLFLGFNLFWDKICVFENPFQSPISLKLISRAFTEYVEGDYRPLPLLTNSLEFTFWKYNPFGHHLTSYLFFLINTALIFLLIEQLMKIAGCRFDTRILVAGLTALLFGIHPLRVQLIAWVTVREHLVYASFYLLSIMAYLKWVRYQRGKWYALAVFFALCAAFSKAMSVSLPLVLLILDYYPLLRWNRRRWKKIIVEKIPFLIIALLTAARSYQIVREIGIMHPTNLSVLAQNFIEFPVVFLFYIQKTLLPIGLAPVYPIPLTSNLWLIIISWIVIFAILIFGWIKKRKYPAVLPGILISLVLILPVGGLARATATVLADRYAQLANVPLIFGLAWVVIRSRQSIAFRWPAACLAAVWILFLTWRTVDYIHIWDNPIALSRQAYDRYPRDRIIEILMLRTYNNVALNLINEGEIDSALEYIQQALLVNPKFLDSHLLLAYALERKGEIEPAREVRLKATEIKQKLGEEYFNRGLFHAKRAEYSKAEAMFRESLGYNEFRVEAYYNLAVIYEKRGDLHAAAAELRKALNLQPGHLWLQNKLNSISESSEDPSLN